MSNTKLLIVSTTQNAIKTAKICIKWSKFVEKISLIDALNKYGLF